MLRDVGGVIMASFSMEEGVYQRWSIGELGAGYTWTITRAPLALPSITLSLSCEWRKRVSGEPR